MKHPNPNRSLQLGQRIDDLRDEPYARFWQPEMAPLVEHARRAVAVGPVASPLFLALSEANSLLTAGQLELENGYGAHDDGSIFIAIRTEMPDVTPAMIDWWFGWHGSEAARYKLWHPRAHLCAAWDAAPRATGSDTATGRARYVGRTSFVDEYVGSALTHATISFVAPATLGLDEAQLADDERATAVCARIGLASTPIEAGTLVHHVRRVAGGSEMRSRFWIGGRFGGVNGAGKAGRIAARVVGAFKRPSLDLARDLLVHCSQEMSHLATFLPALHRDLRDFR